MAGTAVDLVQAVAPVISVVSTDVSHRPRTPVWSSAINLGRSFDPHGPIGPARCRWTPCPTPTTTGRSSRPR